MDTHWSDYNPSDPTEDNEKLTTQTEDVFVQVYSQIIHLYAK